MRLGQNAAENEIGKLRDQVLSLQIAFRFVPLIDPVDHAEQGEGGGTRGNGGLGG